MRNAGGMHENSSEGQTKHSLPGVYIPKEMPDLDALLRALRGRYSSNPIDKVWAIAFPFQRRKAREHVAVTLPIYNARTPVSVAWRRLISTMASTKMEVTPPTFDPVNGESLSEFMKREGIPIMKKLLWDSRWGLLWHFVGERLLRKFWKQLWKQIWKQLIFNIALTKMDLTLIPDRGILVSIFWQQLWQQFWKRRPWNQPQKRLWRLLWKHKWKRFWGGYIKIEPPIHDNAMSPSVAQKLGVKDLDSDNSSAQVMKWLGYFTEITSGPQSRRGTISSVGIAKGAWDQLWKQIRKQVWRQLCNLPVRGPSVHPSIAVVWKQLWKRLWKQLWKRYWKPLIRIDVPPTKFDSGGPDRQKKLWKQFSLLTSESLTIQQSPTIQLLRLFPHPSRHHWFPSWTQVQQYPDVSVRDNDQENDSDLVAGDMDCSLRITSGRIYRGGSLQLIQSPTPEKKAIYCSTIDGKDAQLEATVPGIDFNIDSQINYVLVDISPDSSLWPLSKDEKESSNSHNVLGCCKETDVGHGHAPIWEKSVILVCEEVDTLKTQPKADNTLVSVKYRLRRVTTLEWNCSPAAMPTDPGSSGDWLPFEPSLVHMKSVVCSATGGRHGVSPLVDDPDLFCDPKAVTGLWSQEERHQKWYKRWPFTGLRKHEEWNQEWHKQWPVYEVYLV